MSIRFFFASYFACFSNTFIRVCSDDPPVSPAGVTSDWSGEREVGSVVTFTCTTTGTQQRAVCDGTNTWKAPVITC